MKACMLKYRNLIEFFNESHKGKKFENKECLEIIRKDRTEKLLFGDLEKKAGEFAICLIQEKNIQIGDKIAILGKNRADWDLAFWGTILAGAVPVLIDPERLVKGVKRHLLHTDSKILIMADDYQDDISQKELKNFALEQDLGLIEMTIYNKVSQVESSKIIKSIEMKIRPDETAVIVCTSGTTGDPREVELTHENLLANIQGTLIAIKITAKDRLGHILPPHHAFGLTVGKLLPFSVGATNIYIDKYRRIYQFIKDEKITIFVAVPAFFELLAKNFRKLKLREEIGLKIAWRKLRFCISGSAPLPKWILKTFWKRGLKLYEGYGTTENSPVYGFNTDSNKLGSVGKPIPTLSVKIAEGEILLGGPCIMKGYYKNPEATAKVIESDKNGIRWLRTGDLGRLDEDDCLFITGRKKYVIVLPSGKNVNPELVELALCQAKYVKEIFVAPHLVGDKKEAIKAIVRPDWEEIEAETIYSKKILTAAPGLLKTLIWESIQECQQQSKELSSFEKISSKDCLEIKLDEFEKTSFGKIKRDLYLQVRQS